MSYYIGRLGWLGIGIEGTAGTKVNPTDYLAYTANTLIGKHTPIAITSAVGVREQEHNSVIGKKWSEGDITINLDPNNSGYFFKMALGTENKSTVSGTITDHTFTLTEANLPTTATLIFDKGAFREEFVFCTAKSFEIAVKDGLATLKTSLMGLFPATTASGTNAITETTQFIFRDLSVQFGADQTAAALATPTKVTEFNFKVDTNLEPVYRSGSNEPSTYQVKQLNVSGTYGLLMDGVTERDIYYGLTKQDAIFTFSGANIGGAYVEQIVIKLYNFRVNDLAIETGIDALFSTKSNFVAEYSSSDTKTLDITVRNTKTTIY